MNVPLTGILLITLLSFSCGEKKETIALNTGDFLPEKSTRSELTRSSDIRIFAGESLWEYINGGAEVYHDYNFVEVATADYKINDIEIVADIYRFDTAENAYGLYSMLRLDEAETIRLGIEGFISPASINFVKGPYLIRLTGFVETAESDITLINFAEELNKIVPGAVEKPKRFSLFPAEHRLPGRDKYYAKLFMGQKFLTLVYSQDYELKDDTITLFMLEDKSGGKYMKWLEFAESIKKTKTPPKDIPFDEDYCFIIEDNFYGDILAGLRQGHLVGMINFKEKHRDHFVTWLTSLP
jgi:hypothetical protein